MPSARQPSTMSRAAAVRRVGLLVLAANVVLVGTKGAAWIATGSLAVGSEAANSLVDAGYAAVVLGGLYLTTQPPDSEHPHGHERIEPFVALAIALAVFLTGGTVLWRSLTAIAAGDVSATGSPIAVAVLGGAAIGKFGLYRYCLAAGRTHDSPALTATALDNRNDVLTAGAALCGVVGARLGYPLLDPLAAALVSVGILYTGIEVVRDNLPYLVGGAPSEEFQTRILRRALAHPDVEGAHDVIAHYVGPEIDVSLHIEVEGDRTLREAHAIESAVVESIRALDRVDDVFVHIDPKELGEWKADPDTDRLVRQSEEHPDDGEPRPNRSRQ
ncbi:cation diffusion facilitator family transporter [Halococcus saccharolyticus DSM 5350]|uniref:Cation diffusion facilitator family transporter n=2 Tax=Halococcus saccharolyticus TaxID=62319 RepID=M0MCY9_9EURY|nr:cation diffusion facilitator family transporter [Halococcus saccharolyticus DSM 5350]